MKVVIAIDSMKGSLGSIAGGRAIAEGVRRAFPEAECVVRPLADGGEGTVDAMVEGLGGERIPVRVSGPMGQSVDAVYGLAGTTAILEMAAAAGITLVAEADRNPLLASTFGVGEVILDAIRRGARRFIVGIGGSATNDAGAGMLQALGFRLLDAAGSELPRGGGALARIARIERVDAIGGVPLEELSFGIACDVTNPLCGPNGSSAVFGPQKGATPAMVRDLDAALGRFAAVVAETIGRDLSGAAGAGAAGGLGFAFVSLLQGELQRGVRLILEETGFADVVRDADVVVTGEGRLDAQTVMGKAPIGVAEVAKRFGKPVLAFSGCVTPEARVVNASGIDAFFPILQSVVSLEEALDCRTAAANLTDTTEQVFRCLRLTVR